VGALEFAAHFLFLLLFWFLIAGTFALRLNKQTRVSSFSCSTCAAPGMEREREREREEGEVDVILNIDDDSMHELCAPECIHMACVCVCVSWAVAGKLSFSVLSWGHSLGGVRWLVTWSTARGLKLLYGIELLLLLFLRCVYLLGVDRKKLQLNRHAHHHYER